MKRLAIPAVLLLTASRVWAQGKVQITIGGTQPSNRFSLGLSVRIQKRLSLYADTFGASLGSGGGSSSGSRSYDGTGSVGLATWRRRGTLYGGVGLGSYETHYNTSPGELTRTRPGGKVFFGMGASGTLFWETAWHYVGNVRDSRATISAGVRL